GISKTLESMGYEVLQFNAQGDTANQVAGMENFITRGVDGAIIAGGEGHAFRDVSKKYDKAGIPLVAVDMVLPGGVAFTATNNWEGGGKMGMFLVNAMRGEGKVLMLNLPSWDSIRQRAEASRLVMKEFPGITIVAEHEVGVHEPIETASNITKATIRANPDLKGVIATWGLPGIGAARAAMDMGLQKQIAVATCDSDRPLVQLINDPKAPAFMAYGQDSYTMGVIAGKLMDKALKAGDLQKAKASLPLLSFGPTLFIANQGLEQASTVQVWTPEQAWDKLYSDQKKPW
ncbi:MAG: sugar ABC transporter substrate-binding protein, partial [Desulfobacterales bacterium]